METWMCGDVSLVEVWGCDGVIVVEMWRSETLQPSVGGGALGH